MNENKANYVKIGIFVLSGFILIFVAIAIAGAKIFNQESILAETYFSESVAGLDVGSAVKFRGVPIGEVKKIGFVYSEYNMNPDELEAEPSRRQILVDLSLDPHRFPAFTMYNPEKVINRMVKNGMRAKLSSSGVTGLSYIELDYFADRDEKIDKILWKPKYLYIPGTKSMMAVLKKAMDDVVVEVGNLDIKTLGDELLATLGLLQEKLDKTDMEQVSKESLSLLKDLKATSRSVRLLVQSEAVQSLPTNLAQTAASVKRSSQTLEKEIPILSERISKLVENASATAEQMGVMLSSNQLDVANAVSQLGAVAQTLNRTAQTQQGTLSALLRRARDAADNIDRVFKELSDNPSVLLYGQPPGKLPETKEAK